ncbi:DUF1698 domain-containing protein [Paenibacillus sp. M1]|uniref:DUF1698 domain-containing protein n=1 Tax=Paenibacillus haidiansis TaxID=1574488 RepID=A0ABU7VSW9_9BACL
MAEYRTGEPPEQMIVANVPVELIFTDMDVRTAKRERGIPSFTEKWYAHHLLHSDISIPRLEPHRLLFRYFMGDPAASPSPYLDWYEAIHSTRGLEPPLSGSGLLRQRQSEFHNMRDALKKGLSYFTEHPVEARYNLPGRFNIRDGHHRASFLYCSGLRRIPVRMPHSDYKRWTDDEALKQAENKMADPKRKLIYTPILHPAFYHMRSERDEVHKTRLDYILEYLGMRNLRGLKVLDIGCNIGYYSRHFVREGALVTGLEPDNFHHEFLVVLNRLEHASFRLITEPMEALENLEEHDIGLMLTVFYHLMSDPARREPFLSALDRSVRGMLFWESGDRIAEEKSLLLNGTGFKTYVKLADTFGTGKYRELGVFLK